MYNIDYEVCAILISFVILLLCMTRKNIYNTQFAIFLSMVIALIISCVSDIYSGVASSKIEDFSVWSIYLSNYIFFVFHTAIPLLFCVYNVEITAKEQRKRSIKYSILSLSFFLPYILVLVFLAINLFTPHMFSVNSVEGYVRESGIWITYFSGVFYLGFTFLYVTIHRKIISKFRSTCVYLFGFVTLTHVIIQFIYPKLLIQTFSESLCLLILYLGVEKPEDLIDSQLGVYKKNGICEYS